MKSIVILTSLYNDWNSATDLFRNLGEEFRQLHWPVELVLIDDGSFQPRPPDFLKGITGFSSIQVITLNHNMGNQRAIAVGLSYIFENKTAEGIVIMDSDGEDRPADLMRLIESFNSQEKPPIIFAARAKRSENALFRLGYHLYRTAHYLLTGYGIRFGNFSIVPRSLLGRLVVEPNLWLHFAAAVVSSRLPYTSIPTERGTRLHGQSKVNLIGLVIHGIAAISCYNEIVGVRLIFCSLGLSAILTAMIIAVIIIRFATPWAILGWATDAVGLLLILLVQVSIIILAFAAIAISNRKAQFFFPIQQYKFLIRDVESIQ